MVIFPEIPQGRRPSHEEDKRKKSNESSQTRRYRNQPEEATPERSTQHSKQPPQRHGMMHNQA